MTASSTLRPAQKVNLQPGIRFVASRLCTMPIGHVIGIGVLFSVFRFGGVCLRRSAVSTEAIFTSPLSSFDGNTFLIVRTQTCR